jgi:hypothetical protein
MSLLESRAHARIARLELKVRDQFVILLIVEDRIGDRLVEIERAEAQRAHRVEVVLDKGVVPLVYLLVQLILSTPLQVSSDLAFLTILPRRSQFLSDLRVSYISGRGEIVLLYPVIYVDPVGLRGPRPTPIEVFYTLTTTVWVFDVGNQQRLLARILTLGTPFSVVEGLGGRAALPEPADQSGYFPGEPQRRRWVEQRFGVSRW